MPGPCLVGNSIELANKGRKTQQGRGGEEETGREVAWSIVWPWSVPDANLCSLHRIFLWELGFLPWRQQEQLSACEKCQEFLGAAKAQHADPGCKQKSSLVMKEALGVTWKDNWRPWQEVTQPNEQCRMLLVVSPYKKLHGFLSPKLMSFFAAWQISSCEELPSSPRREWGKYKREWGQCCSSMALLPPKVKLTSAIV